MAREIQIFGTDSCLFGCPSIFGCLYFICNDKKFNSVFVRLDILKTLCKNLSRKIYKKKIIKCDLINKRLILNISVSIFYMFKNINYKN